ncbi:hypothetical protein B0T20DRAFT_146400 [Sordaria brevicollis]|uniref:Uncharacterized protein n=1 Tax=Sordaria brevicollis TaxID=83679 RepID=A0AAE0PIB8_SORBR|nr:hypothetical protein B0T20DRAFT_146400 [Sordaria brevicollis]
MTEQHEHAPHAGNWQQRFDTETAALALPQTSSSPLHQGNLTSHHALGRQDIGNSAAGVETVTPVNPRQKAVTVNAMSTDYHYATAGAAIAGFVTTPTHATTTEAIPTIPQCINNHAGGCTGCGSSVCSCSGTVTAPYNLYGDYGWGPQNTAPMPMPVPGLIPAAAPSAAAADTFVVDRSRDSECGVPGMGVDRNNYPATGSQLVMHANTSHDQLHDTGAGVGGGGSVLFGGGSENSNQNQLDSKFPAPGPREFPQQHAGQHEAQVHVPRPHPSQRFWSESDQTAGTPMSMREPRPVPLRLGTSPSVELSVAAPGYPSPHREGFMSFQQQQQQQAYDGMVHHYHQLHDGHRSNTTMMVTSPNLGFPYHHLDTRQQGGESFATYHHDDGQQHFIMAGTNLVMDMQGDMDMNTGMGLEVPRDTAEGSRHEQQQQQQQHHNFMVPDNQKHTDRRPSYIMPMSMPSSASDNIRIRMDGSSQSVAASPPRSININMDAVIAVSGLWSDSFSIFPKFSSIFVRALVDELRN